MFNNRQLEKVFDEALNQIMINGKEGKELVDEFLKINLEANTGKKLKEVVSTIQKEQNEIIRWPKNLPIIVQGSAGSGKTTIALHRLAYLIYRYNDNLNGEDILVLAQNKLFLNYISDILPSLDVSEVKQNTFEDLLLSKLNIKLKIYDKDEKIKHIGKNRELYKKRCDLAMETMEKEFPESVKFNRPDGGLFAWVKLPSHVNVRELLEECLKENVASFREDHSSLMEAKRISSESIILICQKKELLKD